jgi:uncharacterized membrane protein
MNILHGPSGGRLALMQNIHEKMQKMLAAILGICFHPN